MEKELQEQFEKVLSDNVGNFWAGTDNIISFIDQNFIGKEALRDKIEDMESIEVLNPNQEEKRGFKLATSKLLKLLK